METARDKLLDDFLLDRLNEQDKATFMENLKNDVTLKEALELRKVMIEQVKTIGDQKLKEKILKIQEKVETEEKKPGIRRYLGPIASIAAGFLLLFLAYQWWQTQSGPQDLYAQYYQAYDQLPFQSRDAGDEQAIAEAGALYLKGNYEEALPLLKNIQAAGKGDDRITLALAICQLETQQYEAAINTLRQASRVSGFLYKDQAKWYMALAYLKLDQNVRARQILQTIADYPASHFNTQAKELLDKMRD